MDVGAWRGVQTNPLTVQKRLEFIQNETERLDKMVKSMENKQETKHRQIQELQKKLQTLAAK